MTISAANAGSVKLGGELEINRIGLGTNRIEDNGEAGSILPAAVDLGVNFIDTADIYQGGQSERVIGSLIGNSPRAHIATKGGYYDADPDKIRVAIDESRKRLALDTIDLYYLHKPSPTIPIEHSIDPIISAKQDGRIRLVGLSNVDVAQIDRIRRLVDVAAVQNVYNLDDTSNEDVIDYCERHGIVFVPYFPLRGSQRAQAVADRLGATRHQVVLAALLARSPVIVPIPGTLQPDHLESNLRAGDLKIDQTTLKELGLGAN